ncbi:hypothetical protein ACWGRL_01615 [[Kitasatospora] papulosa]
MDAVVLPDVLPGIPGYPTERRTKTVNDDEFATELPEAEDWLTRLRDAQHLGSPVWRPADIPGSDLAFPPVDNGLDYLVSVVDHLEPDEEGEAPSARALKYAVLHLEAAAEVLLKARLEAIHWTLVIERITNAVTWDRYTKGEFNSIGSAEAVRRLRDIAGVEISSKGAGALASLHGLRNKLQHYGLSARREEIEPFAATVLDFLVAFVDEQLLPVLGPSDRSRADNDMAYVRQGLNRIQAYVDERMARLRSELAGLEDRTVTCPRCYQDAAVAGDGEPPTTVRCRFCLTSWPPDVFAPLYTSGVNSGWFAEQTVRCTDCSRTDTVTRHVIRVADLNANADDPDAPRGLLDAVTFCFACAVSVKHQAQSAEVNQR